MLHDIFIHLRNLVHLSLFTSPSPSLPLPSKRLTLPHRWRKDVLDMKTYGDNDVAIENI